MDRTTRRALKFMLTHERRSAKIPFVPESPGGARSLVGWAPRPHNPLDSRCFAGRGAPTLSSAFATIVQQLDEAAESWGSPSFGLRSSHRLDPSGEARHLARGRLLVDDTLLRRAGEDGLRRRQGVTRGGLVSGGERLFDLADMGFELGAPRLVDLGAAEHLARGLLGRSRVGHRATSSGNLGCGRRLKHAAVTPAIDWRNRQGP